MTEFVGAEYLIARMLIEKHENLIDWGFVLEGFLLRKGLVQCS